MLDQDDLRYIEDLIGPAPEWEPERPPEPQIERWKAWSARKILIGTLRAALGIDPKE